MMHDTILSSTDCIEQELLVWRESDNADLLCSDTELLKVP